MTQDLLRRTADIPLIGYATGVTHEQVAEMFPAKRWGMPEDVAKLVAWLVSDDAAWITGQVLDQEGGLRRWAQVKASE